MKKIVNVLNRILFYGFFLCGVFTLLFYPGNKSAILFAFGSFLASWSLSWVLNLKGLGEKQHYYLGINLALLLNLLGEIAVYYSVFSYYDKILHFIVGILITAILYAYYSKSLKVKKDMIFFTTLGMLAIWEIYEFALTFFFGYPTQGVMKNGAEIMSRIDDTIFDLICGSIGSIGYLIFKNKH